MERKGFIKRTDDAAKMQSHLRKMQEHGVALNDIVIADDYQITLNSLAPGDILVVCALSDICIGIRGLFKLIYQLSCRNVQLCSASEQWFDMTNTSFNWTTFSAEMLSMDKQLRSERTKEALSSLKANGVKLGRPQGSVSALGVERLNRCINPYSTTDMSVVEICKTNNVNLRTFYRFLKEHNIPKRKTNTK